MSDGIFVMTAGRMEILEQSKYDNEDMLQGLLEQHPQLIAGMATGDEHPRLLLVKREAGVSSTAAGSPGYSLDHLYVDSEAVPVFVEVKLSSDTRIRREVVGQLLDYVALGVPDWQGGRMREVVKLAHPTETESEVLARVFGRNDEPETYWARVEANLAAKHVRMVFVADRLPEDLKRVIEFLNEQMRDVDVLGVEVPLYGTGAVKAFVPKVIGDTSAARQTKEQWTFETFLTHAAGQGLSEGERGVVTALLEHVAAHGRASYGRAATPGVNGWYAVGDGQRPVWYLTTSGGPGKAYMYFYPNEVAKHAGEQRAHAFADALATVPDLSDQVEQSRANGWSKWPTIQLHRLASDDSLLPRVFAAVDTASATGHAPDPG